MNRTWHVAKKELQEMFRDKRVRTGAFIMPVLLIIMMVGLTGFLVKAVGKNEGTKVHVVKSTSPLLEAFRKAKFEVVDVATREEGEALVKSGKARILLEIKDSDNGQLPIDAIVDPKNQTGQIALARVSAVVEIANKAAIKEIFRLKNIPESAQEAIKLKVIELQIGDKASAGDMIVGLLPYLIIIWAFYGAMGIVGDLVAGEKEKNTLETLLITPAGRNEIVMGKIFALSVVSLLSSLSSLVGIFIVSVAKLPGSEVMFKGGFGVSPTAAFTILVLMIPTSLFFSCILVAVSSYAKNSREAQTYLTSVSFIVLIPAIFSQFIGLTDYGSTLWVNFIPILNTANNVRLALLGKATMLPVLCSIAVSLVLAVIGFVVTVRMFNREEVLVRV